MPFALIASLLLLAAPLAARATHDSGAACSLYAASRDGRYAVLYEDASVNGGPSNPRLVDIDTGTVSPLSIALPGEDGAIPPIPEELVRKYGLAAPPEPRDCSADGRFCVDVTVSGVTTNRSEPEPQPEQDSDGAGWPGAPTYSASISVKLVSRAGGAVELAALQWQSYSTSAPDYGLSYYWIGDHLVVVGAVTNESRPQWGEIVPVCVVRKLPAAPELRPVSLDVRAAVRRAFRLRGDGMNMLLESMRVLGWSSRGAFAYLKEPPDEACGCYFLDVEVADLRTDGVLYREKFSSDGPEEGPKSLEAWWAKEGARVSAKLVELGIEPAAKARLEPFPAGNVRAELKVTRTPLAEYGGDPFVTAAVLTLRSPRGSKEVWRETWSSDAPCPLDLRILGYVKSPHEPRIAVVLARIDRGYEGPPDPVRLVVIGAGLDRGFK